MKLKSSGEISWIKGYRDESQLREKENDAFKSKDTYNTLRLRSVEELGGGDFMAGGSYDNGILLMRTDSLGNITNTGVIVDNDLSPTHISLLIEPEEGVDVVVSDMTAEENMDVVFSIIDSEFEVTGF